MTAVTMVAVLAPKKADSWAAKKAQLRAGWTVGVTAVCLVDPKARSWAGRRAVAKVAH